MRPNFTSHISYSQQSATTTELERSAYAGSAQASESRSPQQQWAQPHQQQQGPPSPTRKSMFDFVSPFDALSGTVPPSAASKKKPVPPMNPPQPSSSNDESSISVEERRTRDAKRQSVENLLSDFPNPPQPLASPPQQHAVSQEQYAPQDSYHAPVEARPLLPKPSGPRTESPRGSPKTRQRGAAQEATASSSSNLGAPQSQQATGNVRDRPRDGSPTPRSKRGQAQGLKKLTPSS